MLPDIWWSSGWSTSSLAITTTLFALLGGYYLAWRFSRFARLINALPGPKPLPLLGNLLHLLNFSFEKVIVNMACNNRIYTLWISFYPVVFISHPELWKAIFSSTTNVGKPKEYTFVFPNNTLVVFGGEQWKNRRRMLNPAFHFQILSGFIDTFNDVSLGYVSKIDEIIRTTGSKEIKLSPIISKLVLDILCATTLGGNFKKVLSEEEWANYILGIKGIEHIFMERAFHRPWLRINWIFKLSSLYQQHKKIKSNCSTTIDKIIKYRRELHEQKAVNCSIQSDSVSNKNAEEQDKYSRPKEKLAVLDLLLKNSEEDPNFTDEEIGKELFNFITAGFDTTYVVFTWFFYLIAKHTDHQKLVMDELKMVFGDSDRPVTAEDLTELKYLECCIKESMRIYPPVPIIGRSLTEDVQAGEYTLPKGTAVAMNIYAAHHNPEIFPDPETFKPERFLSENSVGRHLYAFVSFSAGPRICIAHKYAMMDLKVCLANILRRFKFSLSDPSGPLPTPAFHLTLKPKNDQCNLIVSKRF